MNVTYQINQSLSSIPIYRSSYISVTIQNRGEQAWQHCEPQQINLSYHWLSPSGQTIEHDGVRTNLPHDLAVGESITLEMQIEPPEQAGDYLLELDLVQEGVGWFSAMGANTLRHAVRVQPNTSNAPRVCIINGNCLANDAVGNHVINQLNAFLARGYQAMVLVETIDQRIPAESRAYIGVISYDQLRKEQRTPLTRRAIDFFNNADIYVVNYSTYYPLAQSIALIGRGSVIFDYHGITPPELWEGPGVEDLILGQQNLGLVRYADYAIAHSNYTRNELLATRAIGPDQTYVIPYIVPLSNFVPAQPDAQLVEQYQLHNKRVLLYIGRMAGNKRIIDLVHALAHIQKEHPNTVLLLVGDNTGPSYRGVVADAQRAAQQLGIAQDVIFTGPQAHSQLPRFYQTCDIYVTTSLHEGFCIPVVEAMACGKPVVGTRAAALPETIGEAGLVAEPSNPSDFAKQVIQILNTYPSG